MENKNKLKNINYGEILQRLIPNLESYSFIAGSEGKAYFIDDNFIVKSYFEEENPNNKFEDYFNEIKMFNDLDINLPKVYAYAVAPTDRNKNHCFLLEERLKGEILFDYNYDSIYPRCESFCTKEMFEKVTLNPSQYPHMYELVAEQIIKRFKETNDALQQMPEEELEKYLYTNYVLGKKSYHSAPDIHAGNVMFDGTRLSVIDNAYSDWLMECFCKDEKIEVNILRDAFCIFFENWYAKHLSAFTICGVPSKRINKIYNENMESCFLAMRRFVRKTNQMFRPKITELYDFCACSEVAEQIFDSRLEKEILQEVQREY